MIGLITYLGSSPRRILAVLVVSAVAVAATQFAPMLQRTAPQNAGAQDPGQEAVDSGKAAGLFESRPIPERPSGIDTLPGNSGTVSQPGDPPVEVDEVVAEISVNVPAKTEDGVETLQELVLRPTSAWVNVFSESSTLNGEPVQPGDTITAFDPDGTLVGRFVVTTEGSYGLMALYMDDPMTQADEGAEPGDLISFQINSLEAVVLGPHTPVWTADGAVLSLNLAAID